MTVTSLRPALVPVPHSVVRIVTVTLAVVAIIPHLLLLVPVPLIEEDALVRDIVLVETSSSQHKIRLQSIGRIPRGNVPMLASD